ncbi:MAG TPA: Hsp20/alpha crystallin family protein [Thermoplasmatales archaeon]|nr:Hsp20/alpha crystallin family protein [Thermoplasmatales archaeon]
MRIYEIISRIEKEMDEIKRILSLTSLRKKPLCDIVDEKNKIIIQVEMPGFSKESIDIETGKNYVKIKAEEEEEEKKNYILKERARRFYRHIELPYEIAEEKAKAKLENGILEIILPKSKESRGKKIRVE